MEDSRHTILESFPLISNVFPYYSFTHESFLLLWSLSKKTRKVLHKNYEAFRRIMAISSMVIDVKDFNLIGDYARDRLDLFRLKFGSNFGLKQFINFVDTVI